MKKFKYLDIGFNNSEIHSFLDDIGDMEAHEIPGYIESLKEKHGTEIDHILASYVVQFGFNEREEVVDALLNSMNNISLTDPTSSNNILHMIITNDHELSEKLINKGINLDHKNKDGFTPVELAIYQGNIKNLMHLEPIKKKVDTLLKKALNKSDVEFVSNLIDSKAIDINEVYVQKGKTLFRTAFEKGDKEMAKMLFDKGADLNREKDLLSIKDRILKFLGIKRDYKIEEKADNSLSLKYSKKHKSSDVIER